MGILVVELYLFVVCVEVHSDNLAAVYFAYEPEENSLRIFGCDFNVLSFLGVLDDRHDSITVQVEHVDDEFEFFLFGGIPLENELIFEVKIKRERLCDGQIKNGLGLLQLLANPLGQLLVKLLLKCGLLLDFKNLLCVLKLRVLGSYRGYLLVHVNGNGRNGLDLLFAHNAE